MNNPLSFIVKVTIRVFVFLLLIYLIVAGLSIFVDNNPTAITVLGLKQSLQSIVGDIRIISKNAYDFLKPFLQLVLILVILQWILEKLGINFQQGNFKVNSNVQTVIALIVVIAFALAALSGSEGTAALKDIALVVVGFYFGTNKKLLERQNIKDEDVLVAKKDDSENQAGD
jgi:hypothetical protein